MRRDHWGLVLINHRRLPPSDVGGLVLALAALLANRATLDGLMNEVLFLRRAQA